MTPSTPKQRSRKLLPFVIWLAIVLVMNNVWHQGYDVMNRVREAYASLREQSLSRFNHHDALRPLQGPLPVITPPVIPSQTYEDIGLLSGALQDAGSQIDVLQGQSPPIKSGPGIVVCEPENFSPKSDFAAFGAGCGRWLHLVVGGWGALGKTPTWGSVDERRRTLGLPDVRLESHEVAAFSRSLGVTHLALGTLKGTPQSATLTYQVWSTAPVKPLQRFAISGTQQQVVAQLPLLAQRIGSALGAGQMPPVRMPMGSPTELTLMGRVPWDVPAALPDDLTWEQRQPQRKALAALATRLPLAAMLLMGGDYLDSYDPLWAKLSVTLPQQASGNALVLSYLATLCAEPALTASAFQTQWKQLNREFPHNLALAEGAYGLTGNDLSDIPARTSAMQMVSCSPSAALGWHRLSESFYHESEEIRQGRLTNELSSSETSDVDTFYVYYLASALKATELDAQNGGYWNQVATAAAFNGKAQLANAAYWHALRLAPRNTETLEWGLQLFQPKWNNEPDNLRKVATLIEADPELLSFSGQNAMWALGEANLTSEANEMLMYAIHSYQARLQRNRKDGTAHYYLAQLFEKNRKKGGGDMKAGAIIEYQAYLALRPRDAEVHEALGTLFHQKHYETQAERHYRQALALDPSAYGATRRLADIVYQSHHDVKEAEHLYHQAIKLWSGSPAHLGLATLLLDQGKTAEANHEARQAIDAGYTKQYPIYTRLGLHPDPGAQTAPAQTPADLEQEFDD